MEIFMARGMKKRAKKTKMPMANKMAMAKKPIKKVKKPNKKLV